MVVCSSGSIIWLLLNMSVFVWKNVLMMVSVLECSVWVVNGSVMSSVVNSVSYSMFVWGDMCSGNGLCVLCVGCGSSMRLVVLVMMIIVICVYVVGVSSVMYVVVVISVMCCVFGYSVCVMFYMVCVIIVIDMMCSLCSVLVLIGVFVV